MAIPKVSREDLLGALQFIDNNGVPPHNQSMRYFLLSEGKSYPPKYVIAVANHLANGVAIDTSGYNAIEAKNYLKNKGFTITSNQEKYELIITAEQVTSSDECFDKDNLALGDNYVPLSVYFQSQSGQIIKRHYAMPTPAPPRTTAGAANTAIPATIPPPISPPAAANPLVIPAALNPTTEPPRYNPAKPIPAPTPAPTAPASASPIGESFIFLDLSFNALSASSITDSTFGTVVHSSILLKIVKIVVTTHRIFSI